MGTTATPNGTDRELGVLLMSAARHQNLFAEILAAESGVRLIAVADEPDVPDWVRAENETLAEKYGIPYLDDVDAGLALPGVDIVTIGSLYSRHGPLTIKSLDAGKHVLLDKQPMAMSDEEHDQVASAAARATARGQKVSYINHTLNPPVRRAKRAIDRGEIGQPRAIFASAIVTYGPGEEVQDPTSKWGRGLDPKWWSGGELIHHGAYAIGVTRFLMGSEITSVYCVLGSHFNRVHRDHGSEDLVTMSLGFANGGVATLVIARPPNASHPSYADEFVNVIGTHGAVTADWEKPSFLLCDSEAGLARREMYGRGEGTELGVLDLLRAVQNGTEPLQNAQDGLAETRVLWAGYQSAREGRVISFEHART